MVEATAIHNHEFHHVGGGTLIVRGGRNSDDSYRCDCGASMTVSGLTTEQHVSMPRSISVPSVPPPTASDASA